MTEEKKLAEEKESTLLKKALKAFGIDEKYLLSHRVKGSSVILVTKGGSKVIFKPGAKIHKLTAIQITGINPENARRKPIVGKKK